MPEPLPTVTSGYLSEISMDVGLSPKIKNGHHIEFEALQPGEWPNLQQIAAYLRNHHAAVHRQQQRGKNAIQQLMAAQRQVAYLQHTAVQKQMIAQQEKQRELSTQLQQFPIPLPCVSNDRFVTLIICIIQIKPLQSILIIVVYFISYF